MTTAYAEREAKDNLERLLRRSIFYLSNEQRGLFQRGRFSYSAKRIVSACGKFALQQIDGRRVEVVTI